MQQPNILGFDIGGTKTAIVLGCLDGAILHRIEIPTPADRDFNSALPILVGAADRMLGEAAAAGSPAPLAVSVSVGGPLDIEKGILYSPPNLPLWKASPLKARLQEHFYLPVFVEHDGNAGALAEYHFGAGKDASSLVFLTLGTGLGAGIILEGSLYRGSSDLAGEVGHIRLAPDGPQAYGKAGSWEGLCSAMGLVQMAFARHPVRWPLGTSARVIIQAALDRDNDARSMVSEMGERLGQGVAALVDILNPDLVVVGTLGVLLGDMLLEPARRVLNSEALPAAADRCRLVPAVLGGRLGDVSALMAAIQAYYEGRWQVKGYLDPADTVHQVVRRSLQSGLAVRRRTLKALQPEIEQTGFLLVQALKQGGKVLAFGNGGSAAAAQHLSGEIVGRYRVDRAPLPAMALGSDPVSLTCIGNDFSFEEIFSRPLQAVARPGDVAVGFTTSGRSANVLRALDAARTAGLATIALTGVSGLARPVADHILAIPSCDTARIQEEHEAIIHAWCEWIDRAFQEDP